MAEFQTRDGLKYITDNEAIIAAFRKRDDLTEVVEEKPKRKATKKKEE